QYYNAEEAAEQARHLRAHTESIRTHIKLLAEKDYSMLEGLAHSPDFVLMFIPLEPAFNLAVSSDTGLFEYALSKKVVLVTTTTLLATLTTVASIWRQERQQQNVEEIARLAGSLYDKLVGFTEDMIKIGEQLDRAKDSYVGAMNKLSVGSGNAIRTAEKVRDKGVKTNKRFTEKLLEGNESEQE
ncbi:MAG: DNA recombination protein RmuC, partial [Sphingobacteriia bacterium]